MATIGCIDRLNPRPEADIQEKKHAYPFSALIHIAKVIRFWIQLIFLLSNSSCQIQLQLELAH